MCRRRAASRPAAALLARVAPRPPCTLRRLSVAADGVAPLPRRVALDLGIGGDACAGCPHRRKGGGTHASPAGEPCGERACSSERGWCGEVPARGRHHPRLDPRATRNLGGDLDNSALWVHRAARRRYKRDSSSSSACASVILAGTEALLDTGYDPRVSALVTMRPRGLRRVVSGGSRRALFNLS